MSMIENCMRSEFLEHEELVLECRESLQECFSQVASASLTALRAGGKLIFFGNGGSAADAQHLATEIVVRFRTNRRALPALALTTDTSALTAIGNDFGFDLIFARQIEALCCKDDYVIGLSTSGNSENVVQGVLAAKEKGSLTAALLGGDGGRIQSLVDHPLVIPSRVTARIQEMHILLGHILCGIIETELGPAG
jgi:D-sedoheptulose 7-phosphate isomerase